MNEAKPKPINVSPSEIRSTVIQDHINKLQSDNLNLKVNEAIHTNIISELGKDLQTERELAKAKAGKLLQATNENVFLKSQLETETSNEALNQKCAEIQEKLNLTEDYAHNIYEFSQTLIGLLSLTLPTQTSEESMLGILQNAVKGFYPIKCITQQPDIPSTLLRSVNSKARQENFDILRNVGYKFLVDSNLHPESVVKTYADSMKAEYAPTDMGTDQDLPDSVKAARLLVSGNKA